jgi:hypothetical protein
MREEPVQNQTIARLFVCLGSSSTDDSTWKAPVTGGEMEMAAQAVEAHGVELQHLCRLAQIEVILRFHDFLPC